MPDEPEAPRKDPPAGGLFDDVLKDILGDVGSELRRLTAEAAAKAEGASRAPAGRSPTSYLSTAKTAILPPRTEGEGWRGISRGAADREASREEAKTVPSIPLREEPKAPPSPVSVPPPPSAEPRTEVAAKPVPASAGPAREEPPTVADWEAPTQAGAPAPLPSGPPPRAETPLPTPAEIEGGALTAEERSVLEELMREPAFPAAGVEPATEKAAAQAPIGSFCEETSPAAEPKTLAAAAAVPSPPPPPPEPASSVPVETMIPPKPVKAAPPPLKIPDGGEDTGMLEVEDLIRMHMQGGGADEDEEKSTEPEIDPETVLRITRKKPLWFERLDQWFVDRGLDPYKRAAGIAGATILVVTALLALYFVRDRFFI